MSGKTFTLVSDRGGILAWDTASNWTPSGITYSSINGPTIGGTDAGDGGNYSLLLTNYNNANVTYTSTFGGSTGSTESVDNLTIDYAGATLEQAAGDRNTQLTFTGVFTLSAGTFNMANGAILNYTPGNASIDKSPEVGDFIDDGTVVGSGVIQASVKLVTGSGILESATDDTASGMVIGAQLSASGGAISVHVDTGSTVALQNSVDAGVVTTLVGTGGAGVVELDDTADFHGTIAGLAVNTGLGDAGATSLPGDVTSYIDIAGTDANGDPLPGTLSSADYIPNLADPHSGGVIHVLGPNDYVADISVTGDYVGDTVAFVSDQGNNSLNLDGGNVGYDLYFVCFLPGTHILTPGGEVNVEALSIGDEVIAVVDGQRVARKVKWIGYRKLALDQRAIAAAQGPIRIKAGAMAEGLPTRDLLVSSAHCMFLDGKLVPAKLLVNDMTIVRETAMTSVEYYHVELERHSIIIAEGVETESYLDTGNRAFFSNAGMALMLHPEFHINAGLRCWETDACAPLVVRPAAVLPIWRPLADRAVALGYVPPVHATTTEADVHLMADGRRIDTVAVERGVHSFMVPAAVKSLVLASRSVVPSVLTAYLDDPREIGVAVRGIVICGLSGRAEFSADHPALARGWHEPERADGALWRWTTGNGTLPVGVVKGPAVVEITIGETATYLIEELPSTARAAA